MSKPSPIVAFMRARFEYVSCMFKGHKDEMPAKLKTDALQGILRQLTIIRSVSVADGIVLGKMLDDCPLSLDACDQIRAAIQLKVDVSGTGVFAMSQRKQVHHHLEHYQTATDWAIYTDTSKNHDVKLTQMATRMQQIYFTRPSEPCVASAVAIALCQDGPHDPSYLLTKVRRMKDILQALTKDMPKVEAPERYPDTVEEFERSWPALFLATFADEKPAQCPIAHSVMLVLKATAPCRNTRNGCQSVMPQHTIFAASPRGHGGAVQKLFNRSHSDVDLPGFAWCHERQPLPMIPCQSLHIPAPIPAPLLAVPAQQLALPALQLALLEPIAEGHGHGSEMSPNKVEAHETHDGEKLTGASISLSSMVDRW